MLERPGGNLDNSPAPQPHLNWSGGDMLAKPTALVVPEAGAVYLAGDFW